MFNLILSVTYMEQAGTKQSRLRTLVLAPFFFYLHLFEGLLTQSCVCNHTRCLNLYA